MLLNKEMVVRKHTSKNMNIFFAEGIAFILGKGSEVYEMEFPVKIEVIIGESLLPSSGSR